MGHVAGRATASTATSSPATNKTDRSLMAMAHEQETPKAKRSCRAKTIDDMVSKAIADNFKGWGQLNTDGRTVDGLTLRQRLVKDKEGAKHKSKSVTVGAHYYRALKEKYAPMDSPAQLLYVKNQSDDVSAVLQKAVTAYKRSNSSKSLLAEFMHTASTINQKEFVGLSRCILSLRPSASMAQLQLFLDYMRFLVTLNLKVRPRKWAWVGPGDPSSIGVGPLGAPFQAGSGDRPKICIGPQVKIEFSVSLYQGPSGYEDVRSRHT